MYKIFMECTVVTNLLSSQNLVHYIRCLLYIDVTNFAGEITGYQSLFVISGGLFYMGLLYYCLMLLLLSM